MSLDASVLRALQAAGATTDMIIAAVEADGALEEARREAKREGNRVRQARFKAARKAESNADNALPPVTGVNNGDDSPSLDKKNPQTPEKLIPSPCVREPRAKGDYHRLPEGWTPQKPLPANTQAKVDQWPPGAISEELAALHRWAANAGNIAGKGRKKDWDAAWVNWLERRHDERYSRRSPNGVGRNQPSDGRSATTRAAERVFGPFAASDIHPVPQ